MKKIEWNINVKFEIWNMKFEIWNMISEKWKVKNTFLSSNEKKFKEQAAIKKPRDTFLVADTRLYTLPCRSVGRSVCRSVTFLNSERFSHYCSCPTVHDWIAVYPAWFLSFNCWPTLCFPLLGPFLTSCFLPDPFLLSVSLSPSLCL